MITAPIAGPLLGGWISYDYVWPWIFYINIPVGIFTVITIWLILKDRETPKEKTSVDWISLVFLAVGVTALQFLLDKGEQYDWLNSPIILTCTMSTYDRLLYFAAGDELDDGKTSDRTQAI